MIHALRFARKLTPHADTLNGSGSAQLVQTSSEYRDAFRLEIHHKYKTLALTLLPSLLSLSIIKKEASLNMSRFGNGLGIIAANSLYFSMASVMMCCHVVASKMSHASEVLLLLLLLLLLALATTSCSYHCHCD